MRFVVAALIVATVACGGPPTLSVVDSMARVMPSPTPTVVPATMPTPTVAPIATPTPKPTPTPLEWCKGWSRWLLRETMPGVEDKVVKVIEIEERTWADTLHACEAKVWWDTGYSGVVRWAETTDGVFLPFKLPELKLP